MSLLESLSKTRQSFKSLLGFSNRLDKNQLNLIEDLLLQADCGVQTSEHITNQLKNDCGDNWHNALLDAFNKILNNQSTKTLVQKIQESNKPYTILMTGVNGAGKTTTIGKIANLPEIRDKKILFASADTFRAAANQQLAEWANRSHAEIISSEAKDPSALIYTAMEKAIHKNFDLLLIDTAGRQFNQQGLMEELKKMHRTLKKFDEQHPNENWLIIDAGSGQNGVHQAHAFHQQVPLTGCVVTKLDGTAKGGMILSLAHELHIPITYLGIGEKMDDIIPFNSQDFSQGLVTP